MPAQDSKIIAFVVNGEGFHNYHHVFPWDYRTSEYRTWNMSLYVINLFAKLGWAYDLRTVDPDMIRKRANRTGDGSWRNPDFKPEFGTKRTVRFDINQWRKEQLWGWGDQDMTKNDYDCTEILNKTADGE